MASASFLQGDTMEWTRVSLLAACSILSVASPSWADWPQYRGNMQRTAYVAQSLEGISWKPAWSLPTQTAASPTWPKPARGSLWQSLEHIEARVNHDKGDHPLIAADHNGKLHVLLALGGGDRLLSIDPVTGKVEWQFYADAPIRYAPCTGDGKLWFGSDDGKVRALDIATGEVLWEHRIGPDWKWIVGNGRLISPH
ncbi:MAG: PQQ-binding-like beta-propeller repeat protein, partial [Planctomycetota bacterium]